MLRQRYFTINSVISAVTWLIITMIVLIAGLIVYFLTVLDDKSIDDVHSRIDIAFAIEKDQLQKLNVEYSFWNDAYDYTLVRHDQSWIKDTYQDYLLPTYNLSYVAVIKSDMRVEVLAKRHDNDIFPQAVLSSSVLEMLTMIQQGDLTEQKQPFFSEFEGNIFLVSAEPFRDEETGDIVDGSYLILAKELNGYYLSTLSERYRLPDLSLDSGGKYDDSMALYGVTSAGKSVGYLYWYTPRITSQIAPYMIIIMFAFLVITVVLARLLLNKDFRDIALYQEKLFTAATTDSLTNSANRRYFMELGKKEFQIQVLQKQPMSVLVFDLDHFKSVNDTYGHAVGDAALKHFTQICQKNVRGTDVFGRIGGEEFAVVLSGVSQEKGMELGERIRNALSSTPLDIDRKSVPLTVSVGLATLTEQTSFGELLDNADKALYLAKNSGRNVVKSYE